MTRTALGPPTETNDRRQNFVAILISFAVVSILYFNFAPTPVGGGPLAFASTIANVPQVAPTIPPPPPLPTLADSPPPASEKPGQPPHPRPREVPVESADPAVKSPSPDDKGPVPAAATKPVVNVLSGSTALYVNLRMLENSSHKLERISDYTATFSKRERIDGELTEAQVVELKMRHAPFSVYMKWLVGGKGRQVLYVQGQNKGKMLVQLGGWKRRFPSLKLDPNGSLAMRESRYPITKAGLLELVRMAISYRKNDLANLNHVRCQMIDNQKFDKFDCLCFIVEYTNPKVSKIYRKCITYIDKKSSMPVLIKNHTWPEKVDGADPNKLDETTLVELYTFTNIRFDQRLANADFDQKSYTFR